jgi:hypothetical protein
MSGINDPSAPWNLREIFHKDRPHAVQLIDYMLIMDNFMFDIDGGAPQLKGFFNRINGPLNSGAKASGLGQK